MKSLGNLASLVILLSSSPAFSQYNTRPEILKRPDLAATMKDVVCGQSRQPTTLEAWQKGVFDAQMEAQRLTPKKNVTLAEVEKATKLIAERNNHYGLVSGQCANGDFWSVTTPAPRPLVAQKSPDVLVLNPADFRHYCTEVRVDYAAHDRGLPRSIFSSKGLGEEEPIQVNLKLLGDGLVSVTCLPRYPAWQGPVLWFMTPVKNGPGSEVPESQVLDEDPATDILAWVNAVRAKEKLPPLVSEHPRVKWLSEQLLKNATIRHNRKLMERADGVLKRNRGKFVGENRVRAATPQEMAWLLWNSPRHRSLILTKEATHLSVSVQAQQQETLAVLAFARL